MSALRRSAAAAWLRAGPGELALESAPGPRVLDLGAGTGKLTATLVVLGADVVAVEPDSAMLTESRTADSVSRSLRW